jgi:hypothetical protein
MGTQRSQNDIESESEAVPDTQAQPLPAAARLDVTGTQVCASTLASVSAAVVASFFGVAGTIGGAAVVSVFATVGSAVYGHGIRKTGIRLQQTQAGQLARPLARWPRVGATRETGSADDAGAPTVAASSSSTRQPPGQDLAAPGWKHWLSQRRWGLAAALAIVFVASLTTVTLIELVGQQPLASISGNEPSGGTSIGSLIETGDQDTPDDTITTTVPSGTSTSTDSGTPAEDPEPSTTSTGSTDSSPPTTEE